MNCGLMIVVTMSENSLFKRGDKSEKAFCTDMTMTFLQERCARSKNSEDRRGEEKSEEDCDRIDLGRNGISRAYSVPPDTPS